MHNQTCLSIAWYLSWLQWEYCAGRWSCFMQHSCIVTECLYSFLLCHCVGLGFETQFLWSLDCMWGTNVGCQGPRVHALFSSIGRIVCYGRGDKHRIYDVRISRTSRSICHSSSQPLDLGQRKEGQGGDVWRKGGSSVKSLMHWLIGASSLMLFAFILLLLCLYSKAFLAILSGMSHTGDWFETHHIAWNSVCHTNSNSHTSIWDTRLYCSSMQ